MSALKPMERGTKEKWIVLCKVYNSANMNIIIHSIYRVVSNEGSMLRSHLFVSQKSSADQNEFQERSHYI